jgi:hypothetical protein
MAFFEALIWSSGKSTTPGLNAYNVSYGCIPRGEEISLPSLSYPWSLCSHPKDIEPS